MRQCQAGSAKAPDSEQSCARLRASNALYCAPSAFALVNVGTYKSEPAGVHIIARLLNCHAACIIRREQTEPAHLQRVHSFPLNCFKQAVLQCHECFLIPICLSITRLVHCKGGCGKVRQQPCTNQLPCSVHQQGRQLLWRLTGAY